jgi:hypothetical protein
VRYPATLRPAIFDMWFAKQAVGNHCSVATIAQQRRHAGVDVSRSRAAPVERADRERPLWQIVAVLYAAIFVLFVLLTAACFLAAHFAA